MRRSPPDVPPGGAGLRRINPWLFRFFLAAGAIIA